MPEMDFLDIGGGFTMIHPEGNKNFDSTGPKIGKLIDEYFPDPKVQVIAEPGRYVCESAVYLASKIIGQKVMPNGKRHYYIDNGIY